MMKIKTFSVLGLTLLLGLFFSFSTQAKGLPPIARTPTGKDVLGCKNIEGITDPKFKNTNTMIVVFRTPVKKMDLGILSYNAPFGNLIGSKPNQIIALFSTPAYSPFFGFWADIITAPLQVESHIERQSLDDEGWGSQVFSSKFFSASSNENDIKLSLYGRKAGILKYISGSGDLMELEMKCTTSPETLARWFKQIVYNPVEVK